MKKKEYQKILDYLTQTTMTTLGIDSDEAKKRILALKDSSIMTMGGPEDEKQQMRMELFLRVPSTLYLTLSVEQIVKIVLHQQDEILTTGNYHPFKGF